ncbi:MAG: hypothetical protein ACE5HI_18330 [bacterium]
MNVVRHEAVGPDLHFKTSTPLGHQPDIGRMVLIMKKCLLPMVAPLCDMVGGYRVRTQRGGYLFFLLQI